MSLRWIGFWFQPVDRRVYSLIQFFFGFAALCNILQIYPDRYTLLSDTGLFTNSTLLFRRVFSLFYIFDTNIAIDAFLVVVALSCIALMLNFAPRAAAIWIFIWQVSISSRLGPAYCGWDSVLTALAFSVMIAPMKGDKVPAYGLRLIQLQIALIYWGALANRTDSKVWLEGSTVGYFLNSDLALFPTRIGIDYPVISIVLTYATVAFELSAPLLLWFKQTRRLGFLLGFALHGALLFTAIPVFSLSVMTAYLAFLTGDDLDQLPMNRLPFKIKEVSRSLGRRFAYHT